MHRFRVETGQRIARRDHYRDPGGRPPLDQRLINRIGLVLGPVRLFGNAQLAQVGLHRHDIRPVLHVAVAYERHTGQDRDDEHHDQNLDEGEGGTTGRSDRAHGGDVRNGGVTTSIRSTHPHQRATPTSRLPTCRTPTPQRASEATFRHRPLTPPPARRPIPPTRAAWEHASTPPRPTARVRPPPTPCRPSLG